MLPPQQINPIPGRLIVDGVSQPFCAPETLAKVQELADLVQFRYQHLGWQLRMTSAKRDPSFGGSVRSYHKVGRGVDLSLADSAGNKLAYSNSQTAFLDELTGLAVDAGFDVSYHEGATNVALDHLHATVHTGGPIVSNVNVTPGAQVPGTTDIQWTVTATVTDPENDGVWQVFADVQQTGVPLDPSLPIWTSAAKRVDFELGMPAGVPLLPNQATVTFDVIAPASVLQNDQADLHIWARDTFGSVSFDANLSPGLRTPETYVSSVSFVGLGVPNMVPIAAGTFQMGSPEPVGQPPYYNQSAAQPVHAVTITQPFWIGKYEVTQAEYQAVIGSNPSYFLGANRPVEQLTWFNAVSYCDALTVQEAAAGRLPQGYEYRLPTEAEWEFCCRAGTTTEFHFGATLSGGQANFSGGPGTTVVVGSYAANAWGLHDMHGNIWEWCLDSWDGNASYPAGPVSDPYVTSGSYRVVRGGGWFRSSNYCRSAYRGGGYPANTYYNYGFRVVCAPVL